VDAISDDTIGDIHTSPRFHPQTRALPCPYRNFL
jgi:hypothetical protein